MLSRTIAAMLVLPTSRAWADAINSDWCFKGGRHFSIRGLFIVTSAGQQIAGNYDRHTFFYTVPEPEPSAGSTISMVLDDDDTIHLTKETGLAEATGRPFETWRWCRLTT